MPAHENGADLVGRLLKLGSEPILPNVAILPNMQLSDFAIQTRSAPKLSEGDGMSVHENSADLVGWRFPSDCRVDLGALRHCRRWRPKCCVDCGNVGGEVKTMLKRVVGLEVRHPLAGCKQGCGQDFARLVAPSRKAHLLAAVFACRLGCVRCARVGGDRSAGVGRQEVIGHAAPQ